jgi:MYXO-CTERM domain-containing protein
MLRGGTVAAFVAVLLLAPPAHAYVQKLNDNNLPEYWQASCVSVVVYTNGFSMMTRDEVAKSIGAAAQAWSPAAVTCPDGGHPSIEIVTSMAPADAPAPPVAYDAHNAIIFRTQGWEPGREAAVAITTVFARSDGRIVDADMQINAEWSAWANLDPGFDPGGREGQFDLQNAVTHEFGHLLGFGHTCFSGLSDPARPVDDMGVEVPDCNDSAPDEVRQSVMYAVVDPLSFETSKRTLSPDEVRGVCAVYPESASTPACPLDTPNDGCGCATGAPSGGGAAAPLVLLAALLLVRSRRGRRAGRG